MGCGSAAHRIREEHRGLVCMISARIDLERGWGDKMARAIEQHARAAIAPAAEDGAKVASDASRSRRRTGRMAEMDVLPVIPTQRGYSGGFRSRAWYAGFQSFGTGGSRKRKVKASTLHRRQSASGQARAARFTGNPGIAPLHFLEKGRAAMRKSLVSRLNQLR